MLLSMRRIVLFTKAMPRMVAFYRDVLGLNLVKDEKGWKEFDANGCIIALHNGTSEVGRRPPKIGFWAEDIDATRAELIRRGAKLSKILGDGLATRCEARIRTAISSTSRFANESGFPMRKALV